MIEMMGLVVTSGGAQVLIVSPRASVIAHSGQESGMRRVENIFIQLWVAAACKAFSRLLFWIIIIVSVSWQWDWSRRETYNLVWSDIRAEWENILYLSLSHVSCQSFTSVSSSELLSPATQLSAAWLWDWCPFETSLRFTCQEQLLSSLMQCVADLKIQIF